MTDYGVAVIGAGPSGFYAVDALLRSKLDNLYVDIYDQQITPWGLVRSGVAPDHPKIKSVSRAFEKIAASEQVRYFGNVALGTDLDRLALLTQYDALIYATGAMSERRLGIAGEDLPGSVSALDFVQWYNGVPEFRDRTFDLATERVVVIGNGNVALDVARILSTPVERLATTDMADHAIDALKQSTVREVVVVGRRGPGQAAFTPAELAEIPEMTDASVRVEVHERDPWADIDAVADPRVRRNLLLLKDYAGTTDVARDRTIRLSFGRTPIALSGAGHVDGVVLARTLLSTDSGACGLAGEDLEFVRAGLVIRAIGCRSATVPGLPYDSRRGVVAHERGVVTGKDREYVVGWAKRGASGTIGTNRKCSAETVEGVIDDLARRRPQGVSRDSVWEWLRKRCPQVVVQSEWERINAEEQARGHSSGRPRVKLCSRDEMLSVLGRMHRG